MCTTIPSSSQLNDKEKKEKEWPYFKCQNIKEFSENAVPLLIMELHRLQPFIDISLPRLHVLRMPNLKVFNAQIIGTIRKVHSRSKLNLTVDDGTGAIQVLISWETINKLKEDRKNVDSKFKRLEKIAKIKQCGPDHMKDLEKRWLRETENGTLGKDFEVLEYIQVIGFIHLDFGYFKAAVKDISIEKGTLCRPIIFTKTVHRLTEEEYNDKMQTLILGLVKNRYRAN